MTVGLMAQGYRRAILDQPDKLRLYQQLAIEAVYGYWNQYRRPAGLKDIEARVREKIRILMADGKWPYEPVEKIQKRTIDRRVNEAASQNPLENYFLVDSRTPRIVRVEINEHDSFYKPNPALYEEASCAEGKATQEGPMMKPVCGVPLSDGIGCRKIGD